MKAPSFDDVLAARERIALHLSPTPLYAWPLLSELVGTQIWVKHENHQPVGAFKVRGGVSLVSQLSEDERQRGLISPRPGTTGSRSRSPRSASASGRSSACLRARTR